MDKSALLAELYQARFDDLKAVAQAHNLPKSGTVEILRAKLIRELILDEWDLSSTGVKAIPNQELGELLGLFGIKKSGSIKARRQRLFLHLNHDPKVLTTDSLENMTRDDLHALCKELELPLSGNKQSLLARVAGVLASQENAWGKVKKSLRRPKEQLRIPQVPLSVETNHHLARSQDTLPAAEDEDSWTDDDGEERVETYQPSPRQTSSFGEVNDMPVQYSASTNPTVPPPMIQHMDDEVYSLEIETALMEMRERLAEVRALARDFLMVSSVTNIDDMNAFIASLRHQGFATDQAPVHQAIANVIMELDYQVQNETVAATAMPQSWAEREALRRFEEVRSTLRERLENILALHKTDTVKARMTYEEEGRSLGLDLRVPSVSGRLHALFDLHLEIAESQAMYDPTIQRRQRMMRVLYRGAVHMMDSERRTIERLERNIAAFEELVQTILESAEDGFEEAEQALVIRFLESKGYEVNTSNLRPRVLACAGILGAELGYLSPSDIPRIAPGVLVSETEVDSIVAELKALASSFKPQPKHVEPEEVIAESVSDASEHVTRVKSKIDHIDALLHRLQG